MKNKIESKKVVTVITGSSRGIGFETSLIRKYSLVVVHIDSRSRWSKSRERMNDTKKEK
jgi:hypothetical protein